MDDKIAKRQLRERLLATKERSRIVHEESDLCAVYFPWSVILDEATLKRALLYFDHIYLLAPSAPLLDKFLVELASSERAAWMRSPAMFDSELRATITNFYKRIEPLREAGIIRTLDTNRILTEQGHATTIEELSFHDVVNYEGSRIKTKLPTIATAIDRSLLHVREQEGSNVAFQYWDMATVKNLHPRIIHRIEQYIDGLPSPVRPFVKGQIGHLPNAITRALLINSSLVCMGEAGLTPLVDQKAYYDLLRLKYRQMFDTAQNSTATTNIGAMQEFVAKAATKAGILADFALEIGVPNIDYAELEDVLTIRDSLRDELAPFRLTMLKLAAQIKQTIADPEFVRECEQVILKDIIPHLQELERKARLSKLKLLRAFANNLLSLKPTVPFVVSALTPVPLYAAALVAAGIVTLDTALQTYIERQELLYNNGLAYLINVNQSTIKSSTLWSRSSALLERFGV